MNNDELVNSYYRKIYKLALYQLQDKNEAEDITHDIFHKVLNSIESFQGKSDVYTWVYRIALNTLRNYHRRKKIVKFISFDYESTPESTLTDLAADDPAIISEEAQQKLIKLKKLDEAIKILSDREKNAFFFFHYENMKQKEIAKVMGTSVSAVESLIFKSMKKIKRSLAGF